MPSFSVEVEFEVVCNECGAGLCRQTRIIGTHDYTISVEPCERCLQKREDLGYDKGYKQCEDDKK